MAAAVLSNSEPPAVAMVYSEDGAFSVFPLASPFTAGTEGKLAAVESLCLGWLGYSARQGSSGGSGELSFFGGVTREQFGIRDNIG